MKMFISRSIPHKLSIRPPRGTVFTGGMHENVYSDSGVQINVICLIRLQLVYLAIKKRAIIYHEILCETNKSFCFVAKL